MEFEGNKIATQLWMAVERHKQINLSFYFKDTKVVIWFIISQTGEVLKFEVMVGWGREIIWKLLKYILQG